MALRTIVQDGDPILKKVCRPVTKFDDRLGTLLDDMKETLLAANGLGLAGPQVGMMRRLFICLDDRDLPEEVPANYEYKFIEFINPEIDRAGLRQRGAHALGVGVVGHVQQYADVALAVLAVPARKVLPLAQAAGLAAPGVVAVVAAVGHELVGILDDIGAGRRVAVICAHVVAGGGDDRGEHIVGRQGAQDEVGVPRRRDVVGV